MTSPVKRQKLDGTFSDNRGTTAIRQNDLFHLAWTTARGKFWTDPANEAWSATTLDVVARFIAAGGRRRVIAGSCAGFDWSGMAPLIRRPRAAPRHHPLRPG